LLARPNWSSPATICATRPPLKPGLRRAASAPRPSTPSRNCRDATRSRREAAPSAAAEYRSHHEPGRAHRLHSRQAPRGTAAGDRRPHLLAHEGRLSSAGGRGVLRRVYGDVTNDGGPEPRPAECRSRRGSASRRELDVTVAADDQRHRSPSRWAVAGRRLLLLRCSSDAETRGSRSKQRRCCGCQECRVRADPAVCERCRRSLRLGEGGPPVPGRWGRTATTASSPRHSAASGPHARLATIGANSFAWEASPTAFGAVQRARRRRGHPRAMRNRCCARRCRS
jgi:hypothetical protein